ncbi:16S rRNA (cytosine(967)-C(5))-methyltransferase RsmB [Wohlfahrtiimonas larvae]|uniref:16S rRNA (cytosine(967)-C(5))-methyltransferase n=1 Tax=Wohlfahrtiimonas larvae TaxID=1157986 RepID=A0ABP9MNH5_9GAMM|nr:16S rRNA (cytosine(967)-C(5))-methyltransferase RsmB [Wohlfahrtiimonas larvae]
MSEQTTLNGVKVSYKPKSDKPKQFSDDKKRSQDSKKRVYFDKGQSKPARPYANKSRNTQAKKEVKPNVMGNPFAHMMRDARFCAVDIVFKVENGQSLSELLITELKELNDNDKRFVQHLVYGALRYFEILEFQLTHYLQKPIKPSERHVYLAILLAIYEITEMNTAEYAAVNNWVTLIRQMNKDWAVGLTNGILRKVLREGLQPLPKNTAKVSLPKWLSESLIKYWGVEKACAVAEHFLTHPQMTIRINPLQVDRDQYSVLLSEVGIEHVKHDWVDSAIVLREAVSVSVLPNFSTGMSSVQDASAQLAAQLLAPKDHEVIIDACAAPGGKTVAMLERNQNIQAIYAIDSVEKRLLRVKENISRVFAEDLASKVKLSAIDFEIFQLDNQADAVLLDVPCSATGIIHRHPDIKRLRQVTDIKPLVEVQAKLLENAWAQLKPGGRLLYSTCSILKEENEQQMKAFFAKHEDASEIECHLPFAERESFGYQILPISVMRPEKMDGFYYCLIQKAHD